MIKKTSFDFLRQLASNNDRNWFLAHKNDYENARENALDFTSGIIGKIAKIDPAISAETEAKSCLMRIYRDVRFSKDKSPYKTNFGIGISPDGKNMHGPGYYIHIQPGQSFVAGGSWMPEPDLLKAFRQEIDYNGQEFHKIVDNSSFKSCFGELNTDEKLKTVPKGYASDHPDIEYLKLKSFIAVRQVKDELLSKSDAVGEVADIVEKLYPLMVFLRNAIA